MKCNSPARTKYSRIGDLFLPNTMTHKPHVLCIKKCCVCVKFRIGSDKFAFLISIRYGYSKIFLILADSNNRSDYWCCVLLLAMYSMAPDLKVGFETAK